MNFVYIEIIHGFDRGKIYPLADGATSLGRNKHNSIVLNSQEKIVSNHHAIIYKSPERIYFQDLLSTNGSYVNEIRVEDANLTHNDILKFGKTGTRFRLIVSETELIAKTPTSATAEHSTSNITTTIKENHFSILDPKSQYQENVLSSPSVDMFYEQKTFSNQTPPDKFPEMINSVKQQKGSIGSRIKVKKLEAIYNAIVLNKRKWQVAILIGITCSLLPAIFFTTQTILQHNTASRKMQKSVITHEHKPITDDQNGSSKQVAHSTKLPFGPQPQRVGYKSNFHFSPNVVPLEEEIGKILSEFGENDYSIPEEMIERVRFYTDLFSGKMKAVITRHIKRMHEYFPLIQKILKEKNLPAELAYISMLESGFDPFAKSHAGAYGIWQFMPHTARRFGLIVNDKKDERTDPEKSTYAAAAYFNELIALYGGKSSVMLAMAAYNAGEGKINNALRKIEDPLKNRDFWYIYRKGYLADETNEYIPKVIALIIICENKASFGLSEDESIIFSEGSQLNLQSDDSEIMFSDE